MTFWMYILRCADGSYYTGHTDALEARLAQHRNGEIPDCHTFKRRPVDLVYSQDFESRDEAFRAEHQVKGWRREKKEALIAGQFDLLPGLARTARNARCAGSVLRQAQDERGLRQAQDERGFRQAQDERGARQAQDEREVRPATNEREADDIASSDERWMRHALALADRAQHEDDEIPVGAVVVDSDGAVLGEGWNRNIIERDPAAHAEIVAMRAAGARIGNHRLVGCTLYVTLEPCAMCAMAMIHARLARVVYGATDPKTGAAGSVFDLLADPRHNHRIQVTGGVLADEAGSRLTAYFRAKRGKPVP
jgi:tRNA(Arg) A34 adenosine deaminase TadA/predicted GIY-YIG superfamily endonuclease